MKIKVAEIYIAPERQRTKVSESKIAELAVSIKANGQIHPITVEPYCPESGQPSHLAYKLIAGYRRLLATALLKELEIEATLRPDLNRLQREEIELDENLMREELHFTDEVKAKARIAEVRKELYGDGIREVAEHLGESRGEVWEDIRLAKAMEIMPELAKAKNKSQAHSKLRLIARRASLTAKAEELQQAAKAGDESLVAGYAHKVKLGDCTQVVKGWTDGCLHCVITDPPYGIDLDQGETKKGSAHPVIYDDDHFDIMDLYARIAKEAYRLLREDTHAYFFFDIKAYAKVYSVLTDAGFKVDPVPLVWAKPGSGQVNHPDSRWASCYECAFFCRKGDRALLRQGQSNVLSHDPVPPKKKIHPVEKPTSLLRQLIESSTVPGETVADFFGGSGSLAEAALQTGRNFLIVEKDPAFHAGIIDRLSKFDNTPEAGSEGMSEEDEELWEEAMSGREKQDAV